MLDQTLRRVLMTGTAAGVLLAGPALAQQEQCAQRLDQIEQKLGEAELDSQRQGDIDQVIEGARLLAETGDQEGCMNVVAELDQLMATLDESGRLETAQGAQQDEQAQAGDQSGQEDGTSAKQVTQTADQPQAPARAEQGQESDTSAQQMTQTGDQPQTDDQQQAPASAKQTSQGATSAAQMAKTGDASQTGDQQQGESAEQVEGQADVTARVAIEQPQPQVVVRQKPPKITVHIPKPIITVRMPPPEVQVQMPDPEVQVEQADPDIQVVMGQPDVQLQGTQAQGEEGQQQAQADVQFEREQQQQAEIDVQIEEPEVRVEQEEANVQIAEGGQAQSQVGQQPSPENQQQQQMQAAPTGEQPTPTAKERLDESAGADESQGQPQSAQALQGAEPEQDLTATPQERPEEQAAAENPLAAMPASDVIGAEVKNQDGDTVAEIVDLVKRQGEEDLFAVLSVGGFLGIGDKEVMVPVSELHVGQEGEIVMVNASEDQLKEMPEYKEEGFESTAQLEQPSGQPQ